MNDEIKQLITRNRNRKDAIIIKHVKGNPFCLQDAFRSAASEIGVAIPSQICSRYYTYIKKNVECFSLHTEHGVFMNTKTIRPKNNE